MKAKFIFKLGDPDEQEGFLRCVKSTDMALALWDIHQLMFEDCEDIQVLKDKIVTVFEQHDINLDDLIS